MSVADELAKLAQLHSNGALSDTEFAAAKARLLDGADAAANPATGIKAGSPSHQGPTLAGPPSKKMVRLKWLSRALAIVGGALVVAMLVTLGTGTGMTAWAVMMLMLFPAWVLLTVISLIVCLWAFSQWRRNQSKDFQMAMWLCLPAPLLGAIVFLYVWLGHW